MIEVTDQLLNQMVETIVKEVSPEKIILFGSRASGKTVKESDVDFLVVESSPFGEGRSRRQEMTRIWQALARFAVSKDILVYSREEVGQWQNSRNHIIGRAIREGKVLYERP